MKWVLLWMALGASGEASSGSAAFDEKQACIAGQKLQAGLGMKLSATQLSVKSICVNSQTGEYVDGLQ